MQKVSPIPENAVFYFGTPDDLAAVRDELHPDLPKVPIELGQTTVRGEVTFIANPAPETLLHEILHGYTARVLTDHYRDLFTGYPCPDMFGRAIRAA